MQEMNCAGLYTSFEFYMSSLLEAATTEESKSFHGVSTNLIFYDQWRLHFTVSGLTSPSKHGLHFKDTQLSKMYNFICKDCLEGLEQILLVAINIFIKIPLHMLVYFFLSLSLLLWLVLAGLINKSE